MLTSLGLTIVWLASPPTNKWEDKGNWLGGVVPGVNDVAMFLYSSQMHLEVAEGPSVGGLIFKAKQDYRITVRAQAGLVLNGAIETAEGFMPEFVVEGSYSGFGGQFVTTALSSLNGVRVILNGYPGGNGAILTINGQAGNARLFANAGSYLVFDGTGNANTSKILSKPGLDGMVGGQIYFHGQSDAQDSEIILAGGDSALQIQDHVGPVVTLGRLRGAGTVFLGGNTLKVTTADFCGTVDDLGLGGTIALGKTFTVHVDSGAMRVTGAVTLAGTLEVYFPFSPIPGHAYTLFSATGAKTGSFDSFSFPDSDTPKFTAGFVGNDYVLTIL